MKSFAIQLLTTLSLACNPQKSKCTVGDVDFESIGKIHYRTPSYLELTTFGGEDTLLISEFNGSPWRWGSIAITRGLKEQVQSGSVDLDATKLDPIDYKFENPNRSQVVPSGIFPGEEVILVPDGFSIPGHRDGGLYLMVMDSTDVTKTKQTIKLTEFIDNYWYHTVHWVDMNNDGRKDILTSRTNQTKGGG